MVNVKIIGRDLHLQFTNIFVNHKTYRHITEETGPVYTHTVIVINACSFYVPEGTNFHSHDDKTIKVTRRMEWFEVQPFSQGLSKINILRGLL